MSEPSDPHERAAEWRNWAGDQACTPAELRRPGSIEELATSIQDAARMGRRVRVAGSGHSFGENVLTDGVMLKLDRLDTGARPRPALGPRARAGGHHDQPAQP